MAASSRAVVLRALVLGTIVAIGETFAPRFGLGVLAKSTQGQCGRVAFEERSSVFRFRPLTLRMESGKGFAKREPAGKPQGVSNPAGAEEAVMWVPLKSVKSGALRMFLGFWLMGQNGWSSVGEANDGSLTALYADGGRIRISILEDDGTGQGPVLEATRVDDAGLVYQLQEVRLRSLQLLRQAARPLLRVRSRAAQRFGATQALLLHSLIDELEEIMNDPSIADNKRVFILRVEGGLRNARSKLAARPA
jgi:hypothetical protein